MLPGHPSGVPSSTRFLDRGLPFAHVADKCPLHWGHFQFMAMQPDKSRRSPFKSIQINTLENHHEFKLASSWCAHYGYFRRFLTHHQPLPIGNLRAFGFSAMRGEVLAPNQATFPPTIRHFVGILRILSIVRGHQVHTFQLLRTSGAYLSALVGIRCKHFSFRGFQVYTFQDSGTLSRYLTVSHLVSYIPRSLRGHLMPTLQGTESFPSYLAHLQYDYLFTLSIINSNIA